MIHRDFVISFKVGRNYNEHLKLCFNYESKFKLELDKDGYEYFDLDLNSDPNLWKFLPSLPHASC